jgi:tetratricopeptide (TPR) repeat protein
MGRHLIIQLPAFLRFDKRARPSRIEGLDNLAKLHGGRIMSTTLNLFEQLLARGRKLHALGLNREATGLFERLTGMRLLPPEIAEEAQMTLGELRLRRGQFQKARRHLAAAIANNPFRAGYHFLMATAVAEDDAAAPERALEHLRQAVELEPANADYWCELGLYALEVQEIEEGMRALRRAAELEPNNPDVLARVAGGLRNINEIDEARSLLRAARFRNPRDRRFHRLWNDFQFQVVHYEQQARRQEETPVEDGPVLLPFVPVPKAERGARSRRLVRTDGPSRPSGPHALRDSRLSDKEPA